MEESALSGALSFGFLPVHVRNPLCHGARGQQLDGYAQLMLLSMNSTEITSPANCGTPDQRYVAGGGGPAAAGRWQQAGGSRSMAMALTWDAAPLPGIGERIMAASWDAFGFHH